MKQKKLAILNNILLIFLVLQPFLDIYMSVVGQKLDIFGFSIATLIRTSFIVVTFVFIIIYQIKNKIHIKWLYLITAYLIAVGTYGLLHHINIVNSNGYYVTSGIYNVTTEILYLQRLVVPVLLIYNVMITKPNKDIVEKVLVVVATIVSLVIIITNIFEVSFASYSQTEGNTMITYNFIDWFTNDTIPYRESLSKGFFVSANQIGALLVVLLPIVINCMLKENKPYLYLVFFFQIVAMTLIGTRVASLGWILICFAMIIIYAVLAIIKKQISLSSLSICVIMLIIELGTLLYIKSPAQNRDFAESYEGMYDSEIEEKEELGEYISLEAFNSMLNDEQLLTEYVGDNVSEKGLTYDAMCKYISKTHKYHFITKKYINVIYPYYDDPEFWLEMFASPIHIRGDNRARQLEIVKRIKENNNNTVLDTIFGMGATPMNSRGYMIENDLISHYYNLGVIGVILFMFPFVTVILLALFKVVKKIKIWSCINMEFFAYLLSVCMAYFVGYFAGHVLDEYIVTIFVAVIAGLMYNSYSGGSFNEKS